MLDKSMRRAEHGDDNRIRGLIFELIRTPFGSVIEDEGPAGLCSRGLLLLVRCAGTKDRRL
jgi:hypothetical protein